MSRIKDILEMGELLGIIMCLLNVHDIYWQTPILACSIFYNGMRADNRIINVEFRGAKISIT